MQCDVLIVGAGPAGSASAVLLARAGFDVAIADKKDFPRRKPCGEFLSPQCEPFLRSLGVAHEISALGPRLVRGMHLRGYGAEAVGHFRRLAGMPDDALAGLGIRRERFDHVLLDAAIRAGARWLPRHEFVALRRDAGGRILGATLRVPGGGTVDCTARHVLGADGVHSRVARDLGVQRPMHWLDRLALVAHYDGVPAEPTAEVHLFDGGFFAATTVDEGSFSVNLVLPRAALHDRGAADWDEFVHRHTTAAPALRARLATGTRTTPWRGIGPLAFATTAQTFPGLSLVGDACGYVDPLTGEGIYFALFGAHAVADAVTELLHRPAAEAAAQARYRARRRREIRPRLLMSALLQRALRHPWLVRSFLRAAGRWPTLADLVVTMTGDTIHPRDLLHPSFWRRFAAAGSTHEATA